MEEPDDGFLNFFFSLLNMCASRIMALLVPVHFMFMQEILMEGFVLKKLLQWGFVGFKKAISRYFL